MNILQKDLEFLTAIKNLRSQYIERKAICIPGEKVVSILKGLGASDEDVDKLRSISNNLKKDPTLDFRQSRNGRFCFNHNKKRIYRTEFQSFVLSKQEDFIRHDSGKLRKFHGLNEELTENTAFQALLKLQYLLINDIIHNERPLLDYKSKNWITTVFHLRTITTKKLLGEPALEGVHSDGVDHTMTVLLGHNNMDRKSAFTYIHDMNQKNGIKTQDCNPEYVLGKHQHWNFLDTLLIIDHERKHSLTAVEQVNKKEDATRDMLIFFTRKPSIEAHVSYAYDSISPHPDYPVEFPAAENIRIA